MEGKVARPRGRPRKRPRPEDHNGVSNRGKRPVLEFKATVPRSLLGRYVLKDFDDSRVSLGKIVSYSTGLYRVEYEDGDFENLETCYLRQLIIGDSYFDDELRVRRNKLDNFILKKDEKKKTDFLENKGIELQNQVNGVEAHAFTSPGYVAAVESGYSSCELPESEDNRDPDTETMSPLVPVPPVDLPSSSGTIGIPEEAVVDLLSVYGFLRSFSIQLYICPFGLDDLVGALNFLGPNSLLDAIHVALMQSLKGHLERLSSERSEVESKCLKCIDWSLLDALTWPVYLVQYFAAMGHASGSQWSVFYEFVVEKEYYSLPIVMKLKILQILCDDVFDVANLRSELDIREESEVGFEPDEVTADLPENGPRRVHPRFAKTSACKEKERSEFVAVDHGINSMNESKTFSSRSTDGGPNGVGSDLDENSDECRLCGMDGTLLCCDGCPLAYHSRCIGVVKMYIPDGPWYCPECTINKVGPTIAHKTSLRGAVNFGVDPHGRIFLGTCNHLMVLKISVHMNADIKYYNVADIPKVLLVLLSATNYILEYLSICKTISQYWDLPGGVTSYLRAVETDLAHMQNKGDDELSDIIKPDSASSSSRNSIRNVFNLHTSALGYAGSPVLGRSNGTLEKNLVAGITQKGFIFSPHAYINHYTNGELAASVAATLAVLLSEETHEPDLYKFSNAKKAALSNILLQVKAFSLVASSFFWPSPDKKEITRERCGWCHSCKLTSASRRGGMLNATITGATKSAIKIFSGLFPLKNGETVLSNIAAYILYLEESLRGLIAGLFLSEILRKQWRKKLEEASTCKAIKALLLELEENIFNIALSSDWLKLMDDWLIEHSLFQSSPVTVGATQKRGPGFYHKECTMSTQHIAGKVEILVTCKRCYLGRARSLININHRHPTTPSVLINRQLQNAVTPVTKTQYHPLNQQLPPSSKIRDNASGAKQITPNSNLAPKSKHKTLSWGVIWRKKNLEDTGVSFRHQNVLLAAQSDHPNREPVCWLCKLPYNPGLTYIHCTSCDKWYHIEAIKLESKIPEVVGFKCCKCRRIRSPDCPYMDPKLKEQKQMKKVFVNGQKHGQGNIGMDSDSERMSEQKDSMPSTPSIFLEDVFVSEDDPVPLLVSVSKVEHITPNNLNLDWSGDGSVPGPQKLPVRRQLKPEDTDENNNSPFTEGQPESQPFVKQEMEPTMSVMEWNASGSTNMVEGELMFDYEDMEFEPQTYFSLNELLTTDDIGYGDNKDASRNTDNPNPQVEIEEQCTGFLSNQNIPCQICKHMEPGPDLTCHNCTMTIHSHCSPWEEESSYTVDSWRCGRCREWL